MRTFFLMLLPMLLIALAFPVKAFDEDLLLYLSFDKEGEVADETGKTKDATIIGGAEWIKGKFGMGLELDGTSGFLEIEETPELTFNEESSFTVEFWMKTEHVPLEPMGLAGTEGQTRPPRQWNIWLMPGVLFQWSFKAPWSSLQSAPTTVNDGTWHHIAALRDQKDKVMSVHLDGELLVDGPDISGNIDGGWGKFWMGVHKTLFSPVAYDEFRIWGKALSDDEIVEAMAGPSGVDPLEKLATTWGSIK